MKRDDFFAYPVVWSSSLASGAIACSCFLSAYILQISDIECRNKHHFQVHVPAEDHFANPQASPTVA